MCLCWMVAILDLLENRTCHGGISGVNKHNIEEFGEGKSTDSKLGNGYKESITFCLLCRRGRVGKGVGHLDHVWSYGVREVVSSIPDRGNILGWVFHPTRWLERFSLIWKCLSFQILNLLRTLSSWRNGNYRPSVPLPYEVASHVKQLPFRLLLLLLLLCS